MQSFLFLDTLKKMFFSQGVVLSEFILILFKIIALFICVILLVAYLVYWERKLLGSMHARVGPTHVGFKGLLQPFADLIKLLTKEIIFPRDANKVFFFIAPVITLVPALATWIIIPFGPEKVLANMNIGLLYFMAITSVGIYGIIIAGWASNSKYAFLAALRASAQMLSYELVISFILLSILLVSKSLNLSDIIAAQMKGWAFNRGILFLSWNWIPLFPLFIIYIICSMAETNRHPFDVVEGESEIVAGHMVEYSGMAFALFFLGEYANMLLLSCIASVIFLGGWAPPINVIPFNLIPGWLWLGVKTFLIVSLFIWARASFPRYRYDQIMYLGWKVFIPITGLWMLFISIWMKTPFSIWK